MHFLTLATAGGGERCLDKGIPLLPFTVITELCVTSASSFGYHFDAESSQVKPRSSLVAIGNTENAQSSEQTEVFVVAVQRLTNQMVEEGQHVIVTVTAATKCLQVEQMLLEGCVKG